MTYVKTTPAGTHTTDAEFRAWATALHDALIAAGLVQTSDTGQLDLSTAVRPGVTTFAGYRVYRFADTLQATAPVFVRVDFGTAGTATIPRIGVQVGTATNGAGTLSGRFTTQALLLPSAAVSVVDQYAATGLDNSYLALFWYVSQSTANWGGSLVVDRSRTADGTPNGDGLYVLTNAGTAATTQLATMISYTGVANSTGSQACLVAAGNTTGLQGVEVSLFPHFCYTPKLQAPVKAALTVYAPDLPYSAATVSVNHYGAAPYLSLGNRNSHAGITNAGLSVATTTLAFRAE